MDGTEEKKNNNLDFSELFAAFSRRKSIIAGITAGAAIVSLVISLFLTPIYRAETKILPPQQQSSGIAAQLLNQLGGFAGLASSTVGIKNQNEMYIGFLLSRTVYDKIIDRFGLMKVYKTQYKEDARRKLDKMITATSGKDSLIDITAEDPNPQRAADMANALVEELIAVSKGLAVTEAAQRRLFFEEQLNDVKTALEKAEEEMRGFQEKTGALKIDDQARAIIQGIGNLRAQIAAKEVEYKVAQTYTTPQNPDLQRIEAELRGMRGELNKLEQKGEKGYDPLMPTRRMPSVGMEYLRRLRDLKYSETLYELLAKQMELAKLDEARDATVIQVIDKAVKPERKAKPRRAIIVVVSTLTGFLFSLFIALFVDSVNFTGNYR